MGSASELQTSSSEPLPTAALIRWCGARAGPTESLATSLPVSESPRWHCSEPGRMRVNHRSVRLLPAEGSVSQRCGCSCASSFSHVPTYRDTRGRGRCRAQGTKPYPTTRHESSETTMLNKSVE